MNLRVPSLPYSDFVVFVDESGDHSLTSIDPRYPMFVLSFCVFRKAVYNYQVAPALRTLKFATFGHDVVVLHESELRRGNGGFLHMPLSLREPFMAGLTGIIAASDFQLIAVAIDKRRFSKTCEPERHAYHFAMEYGLRSLCALLSAAGQHGSLTHVVCEARGAQEDMALELEFHRLCDRAAYVQQGIGLEIVIADKKTNSEGLQLADLTARPIGLSVLRPEQSNRAMEVLEGKFYRDQTGGKLGAGLWVLP
jgi:hypothetical protein